MKIVFLDAMTLGSDMDLSCFKRYGEVVIYQTTNHEELGERLNEAAIIITNKVVLGKNEFKNAPHLKLVCVAATGYNNIDLDSAGQKGIIVANVRNYSTEGVAQHTFSLILALENSLVEYVNDTRLGEWEKSPVFNMLRHPFHEIHGKKLGILGYGAIGKRVAEIGKGFGMQVLVGKRKGIQYTGAERVDFEILLKESDILTIHTPLSENTKNLFTFHEMKKMKPGALLINVARGGIVNEKDLYRALSEGIIRGAALDVSENEPIHPDNPLKSLKNVLISPHIAWASFESRKRLVAGICQNIEKYLQGRGSEINLAI
jgi:glycerate dehydrogenase